MVLSRGTGRSVVRSSIRKCIILTTYPVMKNFPKDRENDVVNTMVTKPYGGNRTDRDTGTRTGERAKQHTLLVLLG